MILALDIGNTLAKFTVFESGKPFGLFTHCETLHLEEYLKHFVMESNLKSHFMWDGLLQPHQMDIRSFDCWKALSFTPKFLEITSMTKLPIRNKYKTPATLGTDRIVSVIAALKLAGQGPVLCIDAGTAVTFDFANAKGEYKGGSIAPGLRMRFQALHHFTAHLPELKAVGHSALVGNSTENSIASGVVNGMVCELNGMIEYYKQEFGDSLNIFLTGGDMAFFEKKLKSINFADAHLVLKGIIRVVEWSRNLKYL